MKISLTKEFSFEMAHALMGYDGACKNIHGHSYRLFVTISGKPIQDKTSSKYGMIMDFGDLKKVVNSSIIDRFDHALVLCEGHHFSEMTGTKLVLTPFQPTCENLLTHFAELLQPLLPENVRLEKLKMYETATSYAELEL